MIDVAHNSNHGRARQGLGRLGLHFFFGEGFGIVQRGHHGGVAHFFHHDHGGVLIQRLVDGDHLAHLHQRLDDLGCLDGHLVRQLGHGDGFGHVHFNDALLHRRGRGALLLFVVAAPAFGAAAAPAATLPHAAAGVAARRYAFFLALLAGPAGGELGGLDFLAAAGGRLTSAGAAAGASRLVGLGGFLAGFGRFLGSFGFFGNEHLARLAHHVADGFGFGLGFAATLFLIALTGGDFDFSLRPGSGIRFSSGGFCGRSLRHGFGNRFFGCLGRCGLDNRRFRRFGRLRRCRRRYRAGRFGRLRRRCNFSRGLILFLFLLLRLFFAPAAFFGSVGFLAAQQLGLAAGLFFTAGGFGSVDHGSGACRRRSGCGGGCGGCRLPGLGGFGRGRSRFGFHRLGCGGFGRGGLGGGRRHFVIAPHQHALFAHFHLNGSGLARGVGLLDFAGGFLGEGDFFAGRSRAVAGFQMAEQFLFVRFGQEIATRVFLHARGLELLKQRAHGALQFVCKFGNCDIRHSE